MTTTTSLDENVKWHESVALNRWLDDVAQATASDVVDVFGKLCCWRLALADGQK